MEQDIECKCNQYIKDLVENTRHIARPFGSYHWELECKVCGAKHIIEANETE